MKRTDMTISEAACKFDVTEQTVKGWCKKNYIRGARQDPDTGDYIIPSSAKRPYTINGSPKGDGIYTSIVKAVLNDMDVCAALYDMDSAEFDKYIDQLKAFGVIDTYISADTGIEYYCRTLESSKFSKFPKNKVRKLISEFAKAGFNVNIGVNIV